MLNTNEFFWMLFVLFSSTNSRFVTESNKFCHSKLTYNLKQLERNENFYFNFSAEKENFNTDEDVKGSDDGRSSSLDKGSASQQSDEDDDLNTVSEKQVKQGKR